MATGVARGSDPRQKTIYGRENINYAGPDRAAGSSPGVDPTGDFTGDVADTLMSERLAEAFSYASENDDQDVREVYPYGAASGYGLLHEELIGMGPLAETIISEYVENYDISSPEDLVSDFYDGQMDEDIDAEVGGVMTTYGADAPDYLFASSEPVQDMIAYGEDYGYTPDPDELHHHLISSAAEELSVIPEIVEPERLYALRDNAASEVASWEADGLVSTPRTTDNALSRARDIRSEAARVSAEEVLRDRESGDLDDESIPEAFSEAYEENLRAELLNLDEKDAYRLYMSVGCDPKERFDGTHSVSALSEAVATAHARSALNEAVSSRIARLDD